MHSGTGLGSFLKRVAKYSSIQTFTKYLLSIYYLSGSVPGTGSVLVKQRITVYTLTELTD